MVQKFYIGDIVELKKQHPSGSKLWEITRIGADFKIKCKGCDHIIMLDRSKLEKSIKKIVESKEGT